MARRVRNNVLFLGRPCQEVIQLDPSPSPRRLHGPFEVPAEGPAGRIVSNDPFQRAGLINDWWLKIWMPQ